MPRTDKSFAMLPLAVTRALADLGPALKVARLRRRMTMESAAERLGISLPTLRKLERGDAGVAMATFLSALWLYGLLDQVAAAAAPEADAVGTALALASLPQRVRSPHDDEF